MSDCSRDDDRAFEGRLPQRLGIEFVLEGNHGRRYNLDSLEHCFCEPSFPEAEIVTEDATLEDVETIERTAYESHGSPGRGTSSNSAIMSITDNLLRAKKEARLRQLRLRVPTVLVGGVLFFLGILLSSIVGRINASWAIFNFLIVSGSISLLLGLLPTDRRAVPYAAIFGECLFILLSAQFMSNAVPNASNAISGYCVWNEDEPQPCWMIASKAIEGACSSIVFFGLFLSFLFPLIRRSSSEVMLAKLWFHGGCSFFLLGIIYASSSIVDFIVGYVEWGVANLGIGIMNSCFGIFMIFGTSNIKRVQSWFMSRGEGTTTAAGIAELLGGREVVETLRCARENFYFIRADRVNYEDMQDNKPNPELFVLTEKGRIGLVDAFVSHSWHDDAHKKWVALQDFRKKFKLMHKREPNLWIDKYCIDQNNIEESLASLPVFLAGCSKLLILCGRTYLNRLWCLTEILVFLEMGREMDRLDVTVFEGRDTAFQETNSHPSRWDRLTNHVTTSWGIREAKSGHPSETSIQSIEAFDPRKARCFTEHDTNRLHAVIEQFGYERIAMLVKEVFKAPSK